MNLNHQEKKEVSWYKKKENWWIVLGFIIAGVAISLPFIIMGLVGLGFKKSNFVDLGVIGDFFGGTTVGLLSFASIIFVTAAIIMQKQELELQRIEVTKTREEYEITNQTMQKQQFDSIFFNMINLHHNILKEIELEGLRGRYLIQSIHGDLKKYYNTKIRNKYIKKCIVKSVLGEQDELNALTKYLYKENTRNRYLDKFDENYFPMFDEDGNIDDTESMELYKSVRSDTNLNWLSYWKEELNFYNSELLDNKTASKEYLDKFLDKIDIKKHITNENSPDLIKELYDSLYQNPHHALKSEAYEKIYKEHENIIGHYYRNLYRIIKLIQDNKFSEDELINNNEKQKYRGILRAQFSSFELLMIFYNVAYSKKGEKFRDLLKDTNFFDDHLIQSDFIWNNDLLVLEKINTITLN